MLSTHILTGKRINFQKENEIREDDDEAEAEDEDVVGWGRKRFFRPRLLVCETDRRIRGTFDRVAPR